MSRGLRDPRLWLSAASLLLVLLLFLWGDTRTTPPDLSVTHASIEDLRGRDACERCHAPAGLAAGCESCHEAQRDDRLAGTGFHGTLAPELATDCGHCHVEHKGANVALVGDRAFRRAGLESLEEFDHEGLALTLEGAHDALDCADCHPSAHAPEPLADPPRFGRPDQSCATCHEDPHEGRLGVGCEACHGQTRPFARVAAFRHRDPSVVTGVHATLSCAACHEDAGARTLEALLRDDPAGAYATRCVDCHDDPHRDSFVTAALAASNAPPKDACTHCHAPVENGFARPEELPRRWHDATGFPLDAPLDALDCAACHADGPLAEASAPPRAPRDCGACHEDAHPRGFETDAFAAAGCTQCHLATAFVPSRIDAAAHERTGFALLASHAEAACEACHQAAPRDFSRAPTACAECHADPHEGRWARGPEVPGPACVDCHRPTRFDDVDRASFPHALTTGFALEGAHAALACEVCHADAEREDRFGRRFGRSETAFGTRVTDANRCDACHADVHAGRWRPRAGGTPRACAECHLPTAFDEVPAERFDHGAATGVVLSGAHAELACAVCHAPDAAARATGRSRGFAEATFGARVQSIDDCAACHADPHPAGFSTGADGQRRCDSCHDTSSFHGERARAFDHGARTGFELSGAHAAADCRSCHPTLPQAADTGRTLARAAGTRCIDCHADPHVGQFGGGAAADCGRCHSPSSAFDADRFDHDRDARFALDETHAVLDCADCHRPATLRGGGRAVRYRPLGTACADCHGTPGGGGR